MASKGHVDLNILAFNNDLIADWNSDHEKIVHHQQATMLTPPRCERRNAVPLRGTYKFGVTPPPKSSKGDIYTDVQLETSTGAVKLSELLAVHTVVLLQFFSLQTDEAVCGAAAERVGGLIEQYGAMGLQCLVVSLTGQAEVREFSRKHRLPESAQAWDGDSQKASQVYGVRFLPHTVVIDKAGEVLHNGSEDCDIVVHFALHRAWMENIRNLLRVQKELSGLKSTFEKKCDNLDGTNPQDPMKPKYEQQMAKAKQAYEAALAARDAIQALCPLVEEYPYLVQEFSNLLAHLERDEKLPEDAKALAILREDVASLLFEMKKLMPAYEEVFAPKETTES